MRTGNLYKVEMYRFMHSFVIFIVMVMIFFAALFLAVDNSEVLLGDGTKIGAVNSAMKIANLIIVILVSVTASNYVGREFKQKTINYEVMAGWGLGKICHTKAMTCGLFVSVILQLCIFIFLAAAPGALQLYSLTHILFMFFILCHICTCTVLYIMLCQNGTAGGCLAFVRFTLLEVLILFAVKLFVPQDVYDRCRTFSIMSQWSAVVHTNIVIPTEYMTGIIAGAVVEYMVLLILIQTSFKKMDF